MMMILWVFFSLSVKVDGQIAVCLFSKGVSFLVKKGCDIGGAKEPLSVLFFLLNEERFRTPESSKSQGDQEMVCIVFLLFYIDP